MSKRTRNFLLSLMVVTLVLLGITFFLFSEQQKRAGESLDQEVSYATKALVGVIAVELNDLVLELQSIAEQASTVANSTDQLNLLLSGKDIEKNFPYGVAIFTLDGRLITSEGVADTSGWALSTTQFSRYSNTFIDLDTQEPVQRIQVIDKNVQVIGGYNPQLVVDTAIENSNLLDATSQLYVFQQSTDPIYQRMDQGKDRARFARQVAIISEMSTDSSTENQIRWDDSGKDSFHSYWPIRPQNEPNNWGSLVFVDQSEPYGGLISDSLLLLFLLLIPILAFGIGSLWFGFFQIVRPLRTLANRSSDLGKGTFLTSQPSVGGIESILTLQSELIEMSEKVQLAQTNLSAQMGAVTIAQEEERGRLARELHDDTIQSMIGLHQQLQLAELKGAGATDEELQLMQLSVNDIIANLRRVTMALRPTGLEELGLVPALEQLLQKQYANCGVEIQFNKHGEMSRLTEDTEFSLYRITQEAINNVLKHAQASKIVIDLTMMDEEISMKITDNGKGFQVPSTFSQMAVNGHFGLLGIYERSEIIGATMNIKSAPNKGTELFIEL